MKRSHGHVRRRTKHRTPLNVSNIATHIHTFTHTHTPTQVNMVKHYEKRQYAQKRSNYDAHKQIKPEITYKRIIKYISVFLIGGIILNFLLAILMGRI